MHPLRSNLARPRPDTTERTIVVNTLRCSEIYESHSRIRLR